MTEMLVEVLPVAAQLMFNIGTLSGVARIHRKKTTWEHSLLHRSLVLAGQVSFLVWGIVREPGQGFLVSATLGTLTAVGTLSQVIYYRRFPGGRGARGGGCALPPPGWYCALPSGHDGPCPAHPGARP